MGGGDLNLKKSWHPSTMRNMEKVWKAEQKHDQEKKRIAELQREIQAEKAREDMKKYAEDQGVIEKKSGDVKLDWMYKGPGTAVDHEEYLLGKAIDKSFEQLQRSQQQNSTAICVPGRTDTCLPGSIFAGTGEQVDVARKLQEDPLLAIRKKELESRSQILKNPVKLKQLKEMIKKQKSKKSHSKHKKEKKKKSKKRSKQSSSSDDSDSDLDAKLLTKYQKLKRKLGDNPLAVLQKSPSASGNEDKKKHRKRSKNSSESDSEDKKKPTRKIKSPESDHEDKRKHRKRNQSSSESGSEDDVQHKKPHKGYGLLLPHGSKVQKTSSSKPAPKEPKDTDKPEAQTSQKMPVQHRQKLSDEEKERRRQEMLDNAAWRELVRENNVARYREADKRSEKTQSQGEFGDFMRKQLSQAASESSVASRIKSNINNIQRSGGSMDRNFARR